MSQNLLSTGEGLIVLPPVFIAKYKIYNTTGVMTSLSGNLDAAPSPGNDSMAVGVGVGVGLGAPAVVLLAIGIYKFLKDSNSQYGKV